jgi:hypothetical protein
MNKNDLMMNLINLLIYIFTYLKFEYEIVALYMIKPIKYK